MNMLPDKDLDEYAVAPSFTNMHKTEIKTKKDCGFFNVPHKERKPDT